MMKACMYCDSATVYKKFHLFLVMKSVIEIFLKEQAELNQISVSFLRSETWKTFCQFEGSKQEGHNHCDGESDPG